MPSSQLPLRAGELVEIRSKAEILKTLDKQGRLDELPFMPQMFQYCGKQFRVFKRAHKTCDTVRKPVGLRMKDAVHLEMRCDGAAYGGCQAGCLIFWKETWLKRIPEPDAPRPAPSDSNETSALETGAGCTEADVMAGTKAHATDANSDPTYICQATQLPYATTALSPWDLGQYVEDYTSGNTSMGKIVAGLIYANYFRLVNLGIGAGPVLRWFYDLFQKLTGGIPFPRRWGKIPAGQSTPGGKLDLQPGEWVRVKPYKEILATLDTSNKNKGLYFDAEAVPFCGGTYRVARRISKILDERTGKLIRMKNESIVLEGVYCKARYSTCRMFCPRGIESYWREIWLERVAPQTVPHLETDGKRGARQKTEKSFIPEAECVGSSQVPPK